MDCDDNDPNNTNINTGDADCDGVPTALDCDDNDPNNTNTNIGDADCDGVPTAFDCDDNDPNITNINLNDADCDGVPTPIDCDDNDPSITTSNANDADCDGVPTTIDCDDNNPNDTHINVDANPVTAGIYFANLSITSTSPITVGSVGLDHITFQAGEEVILSTGFHAAEGSDFLGMIDPTCIPPSPFSEAEDDVIFYQEEKNKSNGLDGLKIFPNPLQQNATIEYTIHQASPVNLFITDSQGRKVKQLINNAFTEKGTYQFSFNADNLPSSIYYLFLQTKNGNMAQRMVIIEK